MNSRDKGIPSGTDSLMARVRVFLSRMLDLLLRRQRDERLSEEMQTHLDLLTDEYIASGMPADEARFAARRAFGGVERTRALHREQVGFPGIDGLLQDIRFALRLLAKDRRFTLAAVLALGLGIGVTNTVFTIANAAIFRDLPFDQPDRLVSVATRDAAGRDQGVSYADYDDWRQSATAFSGLAATAMAPMNVSDDSRPPERFRGCYVSANTFGLLRTAPILGRDFLPDDDVPGAPGVVILSYGIWQTQYGGDASVIGRTVRVNDVPSTIIGIMPARFGFPAFHDLWQPLALMPEVRSASRDTRRLSVFGRLDDGADLLRARAEIEAVATRLALQYPATNTNVTASVVSLRDRQPDSTAIMLTLMGAVGFVLLIACANVANLLLARSVQRAREIAIRASLGATRWRIVRQLLMECILLATFAGALGLLLSVYGVKLLGVAFDVLEVSAPGQSNTPYWVNLSMNLPVFLFVGVLCLVTGVAFGLVPALHISRTDVHGTLKDGGRGAAGGRRARWWTGVFVTAELALTLILLSGAGLLWRNFLVTYREHLALDGSALLTMRLGLPAQKYATAEQMQRFHARLNERLAAQPDVFQAAIGTYIPYTTFMSTAPGGSVRQLAIEGRTPADRSRQPSVMYAAAGPGYFDTVGLRPMRGRTLSPRDERPGEEGVVIDQRFAAMFFAGDDPLGHRIQLYLSGATSPTSPWFTIVGVVPTLAQFGPGRPAEPVVFAPLAIDAAPRLVALLVRRPASAAAAWRNVAIGDDPRLASIVTAVRNEVRALDPDLPVFAIETLDSALARTRFGNRLIGTWFGILASIALVLASVGLYAITAHSVASRRQEIGVRMALGAQAREVVWLFLRRSIGQLGLGLTAGIAGALATGQLLQGSLLRTNARDVPTLIVVCSVLVIVSLIACVVPARRAARLDPMIALREE